MARGKMPWTERIEEILSDGEEHLVADVVADAATLVPDERAINEMGEGSEHSDQTARLRNGKATLAKQSLSGMVRFGKATLSVDGKSVRKASEKSTSLGATAARLAALEQRVAALEQILADYIEVTPVEMSNEEVDAALNGAASESAVDGNDN